MRVLALPLALLAATPAEAQPLAISSPDPVVAGAFGRAAAAVPDVDGDGGGDLLVGAPGEDPRPSPDDAGRAHLYSGTTGQLLRTLQSPDEQLNGEFGHSVAGIPDVNGDGRGDLLVGSLAENGGAFQAGRAYLFSGASGALLHSFESPDPEITGFFGRAVAGVEDVDGDGRADLLVGADREGPGFEARGRAYLFSGATGALLHVLESPNLGSGFHFGYAVSGLPDVDGDGWGDLLVGAYGDNDGSGRAYIFSGASGTLLRTLTSPDPESSGYFGYAVSGVPDLDGDGRDDLAVGAWFEDSDGDSDAFDNQGRAYVFSGATGALLHALESPNPEPAGHFGTRVAGIPDVDGDGRGDLGVGAPDETVGGLTDAGRAYVFSGATGQRLFTLESPDARPFGHFGYAGVGVPDVNGDGRGDGVVAAPGDEAGGKEGAGRVYLYRTSGPDGAWVTEEAVAAGPLSEAPANPALSAAPNPFASGTTLHVALPRPSSAVVEVLDVLGRRVALVQEGAMGAGAHDLRWAPAAGLPGGVYLVRLRVEGEPAQVRQVTLAR